MRRYFNLSISMIPLLLMFSTFAKATEQPAVDQAAAGDPTSDRTIWSPTALPNVHKKKVRLTSFNLGLWQIDYAASSNLNLGVQLAPPLGIYVFGAMARYNTQLAPKVHFGVYGNFGVFGTFFSSESVGYYGGGPMITFGDHRRALTVTLLTYGASSSFGSGFVTLPGVGGSVQLGNRAKFNLEGHLITTPSGDQLVRAGAILYGLRVFSETGSVFGDISFLAPIFKGNSGLYRVIPLGIPVLAFGFRF